MRLIKGYRIIDVPVGMGGVLHPLYIKEHNNPLGTNKLRTLFVGNVDYAKERTLEEIDGYLRSLFTAFGEIESVSVSDFKPPTTNDDDVTEEEKAIEADERVASCFQSRFAHIVFAKKNALKSAVAASDAAFYDLTKVIAQVCRISCKRLISIRQIPYNHDIFMTYRLKSLSSYIMNIFLYFL